MPVPTTMTWAGSWPEPEPWMMETLSSRGASARMIRLYSGTYRSVSGVGQRDALEHLGHELARVIHELLHAATPPDSGLVRLVRLQLSASASNMTATATAPASSVPMLRSPV